MKVDLRRNLGLKILSVVIAMILWAAVAGEEEIVREYALPLELTNLPSSLALSGPVVDTVVVRLRAPEAIFRTLTVDRMAARLDLRDSHSGANPFPLTSDNIRVPSGSDIVNISPAIVELNLEPKRQKEIEVTPNVEGTPAPGYEIAAASVHPPTILIEGPQTEVEATEGASTGLILLRGDETETLRVTVNPVPRTPPHSRVRVLRPVPAAVTIAIREKHERRSFESIPVRGVGATRRTLIAPESLRVTLEGPVSLLRRVAPEDLLIEVPLADLQPQAEDYRVEPVVVFPELSPDDAGQLQVVGLSQTFVNVKVFDQVIEP
jgi:hypothetical protein